jgi:uncharacterized YceG family protein
MCPSARICLASCLVEQRGIRIGNSMYWRLLARELGVAGKLHAGEYALTPGLTPAELLRKMAAGDVVQHHFTIVEGWTFKQLRLALAQDVGLQQALAAVDDKEIMVRLGAPGALAEGWFLPETYSYVKGMSDLDVLRRANDAMRKLLDTLWGGHPSDFVLDSPYQLLTLASIVEKETARPEERPLIASVFLHRLRLGMRLQTDPAVIYGLGAQYDGRIHRRDLDADTPYNTYTRAGLPPTPIAMPGKAALEAVTSGRDRCTVLRRAGRRHARIFRNARCAQSGRRAINAPESMNGTDHAGRAARAPARAPCSRRFALQLAERGIDVLVTRARRNACRRGDSRRLLDASCADCAPRPSCC